MPDSPAQMKPPPGHFYLAGRVFPRKKWWKDKNMRTLYFFIMVLIFTNTANGFDNSMMNGLQAITYWQDYFGHPHGSTLGLFNCVMSAGALSGLIPMPFILDRLGRKPCLMIGAFFMILGIALQSAAVNFAMFIAARWILGFGDILVICTAPLLIAEIAPVQDRAILVTISGANYQSGAFIAAWATYGTLQIKSNWAWRAPSLIQGIFTILMIAVVPWIPESPRFYIAKDQPEKALKILAHYHANGDEQDEVVQLEFTEITTALAMEKNANKSFSFLDFLKTPGNRKRLVMIVSIGLFSQWSGNGLVSYYLTTIMDNIGITDSQTQLVINGGLTTFSLVTNIIFSFFVDRWGRRPINLISTIGMLASFVIWTILSAIDAQQDNANPAFGKAVVFMIFFYYLWYNLKSGLIASYTTEILPYHMRAKGYTVMEWALYGALFFNQYVNATALDNIGWKYYIFYCCFLAFELIIVYFFYVETRYVPLEEIVKYFDGDDVAAVTNDEFEHDAKRAVIHPLHQLLPDFQTLSAEQIDAIQERIRVDIIAVHGLNPWSKPEEEHAFDTWRKPVGPDGRLWLRDDLKDKAPEARVFLYQYDSKLIWGGDKAAFILKADEFLEAIRVQRRKNPQRPIIFIGHSLGGLLIEQALVNSHNSLRYASIAQATTGLIFFGTPHDGGDPSLVRIGSVAAKIARSLGVQKNQDIEQALQSGSLFTEILKHSFRNQLKRYQIVSFWEGKGDIVPMKSAIFGLPDDVEYIVELKATHSDMCRFDTVNDKHDNDLFSTVWGNLIDLYDKALERDESQLLLAREKRKILEWLYYETVDLRHLDIRNVRRGDGQWLLQHQDFQRWVQGDTSNRILWAHGIAGSGKTFLSSFVIDYLLSLATECNYGVAYVYFEFQESTRQASQSLLSCLLRQLADQNKEVLAYVKSRYKQFEIENRTISCQDLIDWLIASIPNFKRLFIVIDAPDEQEDANLRDELLQDLLKVANSGGFCYVTSRPNIRSAFTEAIHLEIQPSYEDVKSYIEDYIDSRPSARLLLGQRLREKVVARLIECADGMFLPVKFQLEYLFQYTTAREILNQLDTMSERLKEENILNQSYERAIRTVQRQAQPKQNLALEVFSWLLAAKRTLTMMELCTAISVSPELTEVDELAIPSHDMIIDVCGGFVTLDEASKNVRIAHATARDYLIKVLPELSLPVDNVAIVLATYLTFTPFDAGWTGSQEAFNMRREKHVLLDYAAHYISLHALTEKKHKSQVEDVVLKLCKSPGLASSFIQAFYAPPDVLNGFDWFPRESTPLHVAATIGLLGTVTALVEDKENVSQISSQNSKGQTSLHIAAIYGHTDIAEYLLKKDASPSNQDRYGMTPFLYAVSEGHIKLVEMFFQRDKKVKQRLLDLKLNNGDTALHIATTKGHVDIALLLLQSDASIDVKNKKGLTPQDLAMRSASVPMQNAFVSWHDIKPSNPPEGLASFYKPLWSGFRGIFEDIMGIENSRARSADRLSTPRSIESAGRNASFAHRGSIRASGEHYRSPYTGHNPDTNTTQHHAEEPSTSSEDDFIISYSDHNRNCHYLIPAAFFERVIELSDRQCILVDISDPGERSNDRENVHFPRDPLRMSWVCRLEAETNLRFLSTGLPKGFYIAFWQFSYMITSEYDGTYLPTNVYNCTFGRAVDPEMFASRTSSPLQPYISTTLNFINPRCVTQLSVPQFEPLQSEIPNIFIHQVFMEQGISLQARTALQIDWDGSVAFLIKKVGSAPIEGHLCFKSVEMVRINDNAEGFFTGITG